MNPIERIARAADRVQQRRSALGFPIAVAKKFGDDQAGNLAALLAYYAFFAVFPLLLVLVSVLGLVLGNDPHRQQQILHSAVADFPIIGDQLQQNVRSLNRSGIGLVVGLVGAFYGARGVANAAQQAFNAVWNVPYDRRPGFPWNLLRSLALLVLIGAGVAVTATLVGVGAGTGAIGVLRRVAALAGAALLNVGLFWLGFRLATAREVATRLLLPGAVVAAFGWLILLSFGGYVVAHQLSHASQVYGLFGLVLGLLTWLHVQAQLTLYAAEVDVVRAYRLWPRSLVQPPLTAADQRAYTRYSQTQVRRPEQHVDVRFDPDAASPGSSAEDSSDDRSAGSG
jgi:YihY family inner membrane protein